VLFLFFKWCEQTWIGETIRSSSWLFPVIEAFHLVGLGVLAGAVLIVDLRLLGIGLKDQPVSELAEEADPWLIGSIALMLSSGVSLFLSEATKCYFSFPFWIKMACLLVVLIYTFAVKRRMIRKNVNLEHPLLGKAAALVSMALWFGVAWGGRWIGFS
jgi:uncharacterized membrane protein YhdT